MLRVSAACLALLGGIVAGGGASAAVVFNENFNGYVGTSVGEQAGSRSPVYTGGDVPGWVKHGNVDSLNAFDRGAGNMAIMLYDHNILYYGTPIAANDLGVTYTVSFSGALTASSNADQVTGPGGYVQFILRDMSQDVASYRFVPEAENPVFQNGSFSYVGTGTGSVYLLIKDGNDYDGRYGGAIDDVGITSAAADLAVPEPASLALLGAGLLGMGAVRRRARG